MLTEADDKVVQVAVGTDATGVDKDYDKVAQAVDNTDAKEVDTVNDKVVDTAISIW